MTHIKDHKRPQGRVGASGRAPIPARGTPLQDERVSLAPLDFETAVTAALAAGKMPKVKNKKTKRKVKK